VHDFHTINKTGRGRERERGEERERSVQQEKELNKKLIENREKENYF